MAHEIFNEKFYSLREVPWHKLGLISLEEETPLTAFEKIHYDVLKVRLNATLPGGQVFPTDRFALISQDGGDQHLLDVVTDDFQFFSPREFAESLDQLGLPVETLGVLKEGKLMFATFKLDPFEVMGDGFYNYIMVRTGWTGAMTVTWTPVRVVCMNTMVTALSKGVVTFRMTHRTSDPLGSFMSGLSQSMDSIIEATQHQKLFLEQMGKVRLDQHSARKLLEVLYPERSFSEDSFAAANRQDYTQRRVQKNERAVTLRSLAEELFNGKVTGYKGNTLYNLYNSVVELENFATLNGASTPKPEVVLFGRRADRMKNAYSIFSKALEEHRV